MTDTPQPAAYRPGWPKWLTLAAVLALASWFFGNAYEAVVISPNWVVQSPAQLARLNGFFVRTSPTVYFVPGAIAATALVLLLVVLANRDPAVRRDYRFAAAFGVLATILNVVIVSTLISRLFGPDFAAHGDDLTAYAKWWNALNLVRMALVATTAVFLFNAFRKLDRR